MGGMCVGYLDGGLLPREKPKIGLESYFLLQKYLTFQNSETTNQAHMKLGPVMYHLNTFFYQEMRLSIHW